MWIGANRICRTYWGNSQMIADAEIKTVLEEFRETGDLDGLLARLADGKKDANSLLLLQHALQNSNDPASRDLIDNATYALVNGEPFQKRAPEENLDIIEKNAVEAYGSLVKRVLPDLRDFAAGMLSSCGAPPPTNAVVAAVGHHAQSKVQPFHISNKDRGKEMRFLKNDCSKCDSRDNLRGYIICNRCSNNARRDLGEKLLRENVAKQINDLPHQERLRIDVEATVNNMVSNLDEHIKLSEIPLAMVVGFMQENPGRYGCKQCGDEAIKDCECVMLLTVPRNAKDGWVVEVRKPATGESFYGVLRIKEE